MSSATVSKAPALSTSTLALKFMQNKSQVKTELDQAKVTDDQEWQVSEAVQKRWRINDSTRPVVGSVTHESSYIPFLFEHEVASTSGSTTFPAPAAKAKGRRIFDAHGKETDMAAEALFEPVDLEDSDTSEQSKKHHTKGKGKPPKLYSISGSQASTSRSDRATDKPKAKRGDNPTSQPSARKVIHEMSGVGSDLRVAKGSKVPPHEKLPAAPIAPKKEQEFLKPVGVDSATQKAKRPAEVNEGVIDGARKKKKRRKEKEKNSAMQADDL